MTNSKVGIINQFYFRYITVELDEFVFKYFLYQHILISLLEPVILRSLLVVVFVLSLGQLQSF